MVVSPIHYQYSSQTCFDNRLGKDEYSAVELFPQVKKIASVCCTHGDEPIGNFVKNCLPNGKSSFYEWKHIFANKEAYKKKQRFIDSDLNRSFPGRLDGNYEERRAYELMQELAEYDLIIDWHQSVSEMDDMLFISQRNPFLLDVCSCFNIEHIIDFGGSHSKDDYTGLLVGNLNNVVVVEYGHLNLDREYKKKQSSISSTYFPLNNSPTEKKAFQDFQNLTQRQKTRVIPKIYVLFGSIKLESAYKLKLELKNFGKLTHQEKNLLNIPLEKDIYPAFINGYKESKIYCRLLERVE